MKSRHWTFLVYLERLEHETWLLDRLEDFHLPYAVSPLHDNDLKPDGSGEFKDPHFHVIVSYPGPTTPSAIKAVLGDLPANGFVEAVRDLGNMFLYLSHANNPDKFQYDADGIVVGGGFAKPESSADLLSYAIQIAGTDHSSIRSLLLDPGVPSPIKRYACSNPFLVVQLLKAR